MIPPSSNIFSRATVRYTHARVRWLLQTTLFASIPLHSVLIHFLLGLATPRGSQLRSISNNNLCIFEIYLLTVLCILKMHMRTDLHKHQSLRDVTYGRARLNTCRNRSRSMCAHIYTHIRFQAFPKDIISSREKARETAKGKRKKERLLDLKQQDGNAEYFCRFDW